MKLLFTFCLLFVLAFAHGQDGTVDASFGTGGVAKAILVANGASANTQGDITKIVVQPDGKIIQVGYKSSSTGDDFIVIRYKKDGTIDNSFGNQGGIGWSATSINSGNDRAHSVALQNDGKIVVVGEAVVNSKNVIVVTRYTSDGNLDNSFNGNGILISDLFSGSSGAYSVEIQNDGKILVTGWAKQTPGSSQDFVLIRYNVDGSLDNSFNGAGFVLTDFAGFNDAATDIEVLTDGRILLGGWANNGTNDVFALALYTNSGSLDPTFNGNGKVMSTVIGQGRTLGIGTNQKIYFTGLSNNTSNNDFTVLSFNLNGTFNTTFGGTGIVKTDLGTNGDNSRSLLVQCDGKIIVGGESGNPNPTSPISYAVVRYTGEGTLDNSFNGNGILLKSTNVGIWDLGFSGLAFQDGKIIMAGITFLPPSFPFLPPSRFHPTLIRLNNNPTAPVLNITDPAASCTPVDLKAAAITSGSDAGLTFTYWADAAATIPLSNPNAVSVSGTYYIKAAASAGCYTVKPVKVIVSSIPSGTVSPATASICPGGSQMLTATGGTSYQWYLDGLVIPGESSNVYQANKTGTYNVIISNGNCSGPASNTVIITSAPVPAGSISPQNPSLCTGASVLLNGPVNFINYKWFKDGNILGETSNQLLVNQAGTYKVEFTNSSGCTGFATTTVSIAASPSLVVNDPPPSCTPVNLMVASITSGSETGLSLSYWTDNSATTALNNPQAIIASGTYYIKGTATSGCFSIKPVTVTINNMPSGSISPATASICLGGSELLTATGGTLFQWFKDGTQINGATTATYLATQAGTYSVVLSNGNCSVPASNEAKVAVEVAPSVSVTPSGTINLCTGNSVQLNATSGGSLYQWFKDGTPISNANQSVYTANAPGSYTVEMTSGSCKGISNAVVVNAVSAPVGSITPSSATICSGGAQLLTVTGGTFYRWFINGTEIYGVTSNTYSATQAGTYSVIISNGNCTAMAENTASIMVSGTPTGSVLPATASICPGGSQLLTATGGTSYQWSLDGVPIGGATSSTFTATAAGTYSVLIFNGSCSGAASNKALITISNTPTGSITPQAPSICAGGSVVLNGPANYASYQWYKEGIAIPGATQVSYSALQSGTYEISFTSNSGCSGTATTTVSEASSPSGSIVPATVSFCPDGSASLTVNGGNSYQWYKDGVAISGAVQATFSATEAGTYSADIVNGSCTGSSSNTAVVTIEAAPSGNITPSSITLCSGKSATLRTTGGTSYQWYKDGEPIMNAVAASYIATEAGSYSADIFNGTCKGKTSNDAVVNVNPVPSGSIIPASAIICSNGSVTLTVSGGTSYQWYRNDVAISGATSATYNAVQDGTYTATIINGNCTGKPTNSSVVVVGPAPSGTISPSAATICPGGSLLLTVSGGTSYQWYRNGVALNGATTNTFTAVADGTYSADIISGDCRAKASNEAVISIGSAVTGTIVPDVVSICPGGSAQLKASGGSSYQWFKDGVAIPGAVTASYTASSAGIYTAEIFSGNCQGAASNQAVVTQSAAPSGRIVPASATICAGSAVSLTVSEGSSYQWLKDGVNIPGATTASYEAKEAGIFSVIIYSGSCSGPADNTAAITVTNEPSGSITPANAGICPGGAQLLTATGGTAYQWYKDGTIVNGATTATFTATKAGVYSVVIFNGGCSGSASNTATIIQNNLQGPTITAEGPTRFCRGGSVTLQASPASSYQWYKDGQPVSNAINQAYSASQSGLYKVMVSNAASCGTTSNEIAVATIALPSGSVSASSTVICPDGATNLSVTGGTSYQWFLNGAEINGATAATYPATKSGAYSAEIVNSDGCKAKASNEIILNAVNKPVAVFDVSATCQNQPVNFINKTDTSGSGAINWTWNFGDNNTSDSFSPAHTYLNAGTFSAMLVAHSTACPQLADTVKKEVVVPAAIPAIRYVPVRVVKGKPYPLAARNIGQQYLWQPPVDLDNPTSRTPTVTSSVERTYLVHITTNTGCVTVDTLLVQVFNGTEVFVPKAFTPNRNGVNDVLRPIGVNVPVITYFRVYNRWGQLVFETKTPGDGWDGTFRGVAQPTDTYTWVFEGKDADGHPVKASGKSILIR